MSFTNNRPNAHMSFRPAPSNEGHSGNFFAQMDYSSEHIPAARDGIRMPAFNFDPIDPAAFDPFQSHDYSRDAKWDKNAPAMPRFGSDVTPRKAPFKPASPTQHKRVRSNEPEVVLPVFKAV